jgi:hypothetical protein
MTGNPKLQPKSPGYALRSKNIDAIPIFNIHVPILFLGDGSAHGDILQDSQVGRPATETGQADKHSWRE